MLSYLLMEKKIYLFVSFHDCHVGNSLKWMLSSHKTFNFKLYFFSCIIEKQFPNLYISHEILKSRARCSHMKESKFSSAFRSPRRPHWLLREWHEVLEKQTRDTDDPRRDATTEMSFNSWTNTRAFCCQKASISLLLSAGSLLVLLPMRGSLIWKKNSATITEMNSLQSQGIAREEGTASCLRAGNKEE